MVTFVSAVLPISNTEFDLAAWLNQLSTKYPPQAVELIRCSCLFTQVHSENLKTFYGIDCVEEALKSTQILVTLEADPESLATLLLLPTLSYTDITIEDLKEQFGEAIAQLLAGVVKMQAIDVIGNQNSSAKIIENVREMLLSMVDDVRIVLIKLAHQAHLMRHLNHLPSLQQQQIANRTLMIYAPLANRLGIHELKWQLEDLAFRYLEPIPYKRIANQLKVTRSTREKNLASFINQISDLLNQASISHEIKGRAKHIYSIHKKMQRKCTEYQSIFDSLAIRVLVTSIEDCYQVLSLVHTQWEHLPAEFDDYIAMPKKNGYQSIHTVLYLEGEEPVELQIRTHAMHELNEVGVAAHWMYKEGSKERVSYEQRITWLRQLLEWQSDLEHAPEFLEVLPKGGMTDRVFVFTPLGDTIALQKGSTPLDFAYHIHSDLGHRCRGAKVNGNIVPLTYQLQIGNKIEILTGKEARPSRDWINIQEGYLRSARARAKVSHWFKKVDYQHNAEAGQVILERELKRLKLKQVNLENLTKQFHLKNTEDFLAALGCGDLRPSQVTGYLQTLISPAAAPELPLLEKISSARTHLNQQQKSRSGISIGGVTDLLTRIAACCKPLPGDPILGYVTRGQGVSVHRRECSVILAHQLQHPKQVLEVAWVDEERMVYTVDFIIEALDDPDLLKDITTVTSMKKVTVLNLKINKNIKRLTTLIYLTLELKDLSQLEEMTAQFRQLKNIYEVKRV